MFQKTKRIDKIPRDIFAKTPILITDELLHRSLEQQDVVVVSPAADKVPAFVKLNRFYSKYQ